MVVAFIQHSQRIDCRQCIVEVFGLCIRNYSILPAPISVIASTFIINRFSRVKESCSSDCFTIGKTSLVNSSLYVDINRQMFVEELRAQINRSCISVIIRSLQCTFFSIVTQRNAERQEANFSGYSYVMVSAKTCLEDLILPISRLFRILTYQSSGCITYSSTCGILLSNSLTERCSIHSFDTLIRVFCGKGSRIANLNLVLCTFLSGNDDDTVRSTRTVNCGSRSIFQHGESLNVVRVDSSKSIRCTRSCIVRGRNSVDDNQRVIAGIQ